MDHFEDFPFEEIRKESGDYFDSIDEVVALGFDRDQIWSVTECENFITYGPTHHYVNRLGYVATQERHDDNTYYHYDLSEDRPSADDDDSNSSEDHA